MTTLVKPVRPQAKTEPISLPLFSSDSPQKVHIKWLDSGKPVLEGLESQQVEVSLSHDDRFCLCVAGQGPQGCDIAPVSSHSQADWISLLGSDRESLLSQLLATSYESVDLAGTRLWAAIEALRKAFDAKDISLSIDSQQGDTVLFQGKAAGRELHVMTFPVSFTKSSQRMVAVIVNKK
jgi:phosphopantetheinyl transferase